MQSSLGMEAGANHRGAVRRPSQHHDQACRHPRIHCLITSPPPVLSCSSPTHRICGASKRSLEPHVRAPPLRSTPLNVRAGALQFDSLSLTLQLLLASKQLDYTFIGGSWPHERLQLDLGFAGSTHCCQRRTDLRRFAKRNEEIASISDRWPG